MQVLYTADVTAEGARHGHVRSSDGLLDLDLALPPGMGGKGDKTNPEQLFGAGYAACFGGAVEYMAQQAGKKTGVVSVRARVGVGPFDEGTGRGVHAAGGAGRDDSGAGSGERGGTGGGGASGVSLFECDAGEY